MRFVNTRARLVLAGLGILSCALPAVAQLGIGPARPRDSNRGEHRIDSVRIRSGQKLGAGELGAGPAAAPGGMPQAESVAQVVRRPAAYAGRVVRVRGRIARATEAHSFTLVGGQGPGLLVLLPHAASGLTHGSEVIVTGRVQPFAHDELWQSVDFRAAAEELVTEHEGHPVLLAQSVRGNTGTELLDLEQKARERRLAQLERERDHATATLVVPASIAQEPGSYFGHDVVVSGVVAEVLASTLFTLDEDPLAAGPEVVVLNPRPAVSVDPGGQVAVTGPLQRFDWAALRRAYPWLELDPEVVRGLQGRPLVIATGLVSVLPVAPARDEARR